MHRTYLADVERGARNLSLSSIARLVGAIGVTLPAFFTTLESIDLAHPSATPRRKGRSTAGRSARRS